MKHRVVNAYRAVFLTLILGLPGRHGTGGRRANAGIETLARHHEFSSARDRLADPPRHVRRRLADANAVPLRVSERPFGAR